MIINCINCHKKFNVNSNLIPEEGRQIKCGSCDHSWFFEKEKLKTEQFILNEKNLKKETGIINVKAKNPLINKSSSYIKPNKFKVDKFTESEIKIESASIVNFFSYLVIFIISMLALIILIDTIKKPLINIFPQLEIILFNLFETLKDIKLFIIDLT